MAKYKSYDDFIKKQTVLTQDELDEIRIKTEIISKIIEARHEKGITQAELAAICGWKQPAVVRLEKMKREPQLTTLIKILNALELKLEIVPKNKANHTRKMGTAFS